MKSALTNYYDTKKEIENLYCKLFVILKNEILLDEKLKMIDDVYDKIKDINLRFEKELKI